MSTIRSLDERLPTRSLPGRVAGASATVLAALLVGGCGGDRAPPAPTVADALSRPSDGASASLTEFRLAADAIARYGITTERATRRVLRPTFVAPARVSLDATRVAHVGTPLRGRVVGIMVELGTRVGVGDPLLVIDSPDLGEAQSDFLVKKTAAEVRAPAVDFAREDWQRGRALFTESQGISEGEVHRREADYSAAMADLKSAQAAAMAAENRLHMLGMSQEAVAALAASGEVEPRSTVVAPLPGQVLERDITLGELVAPDRPSLITIADLSVLWVLADVPEARLHDVAAGAPARVLLAAAGGTTFDGTVTYVSPGVEEATRTGRVRIEVSEGGAELRPGMFVEAEIVTGDGTPDSDPVLAVPEAAIQKVGGRTVVFVPSAGDGHVFTMRPVTVGSPVAGCFPIVSGLAEGEPVVTSGSFILKAHATQVALSGE